MFEETSYLFIDGGYLNKEYERTAQRWFNGAGQIDLRQVCWHFNPRPRKVFYYDCIDRVQKDSESAVELSARISGQEEQFRAISSLEGFHVRLGELVGREGKKRQKEVDVQLAVDMMNHAIRRNMTRAVLLSGDRDFKPLVESLIQMGTYVHVESHSRSGARELARAADYATMFHFETLYGWTAEPIRARHKLPERKDRLAKEWAASHTGKGKFQEYQILVREVGKGFALICERFIGGRPYCITHPDRLKLELYFELTHGKIKWGE